MTLMRLALCAGLCVLAGCSVVYKVDVPQGNLIDKVMVESLKPGMTRRQVALIMGTPSIQDAYHQNRWDYTATYQKRGGRIERKTLTLYFDDNVLARFEGNYFDKRDEELLRTASRVRGREFDLDELGSGKKKRPPGGG